MIDIVIGKGKYGVRWKTLGFEGSISQNEKSYYVHIFDPIPLNVVILKDCTEGKRLSKMINDKCSTIELMDYVMGVSFKHADTSVIIRAIKFAVGEVYRQASNAKEAEIRRALGLS